jgi:uncharacterized protein YggT (Ycf19 family)
VSTVQPPPSTTAPANAEGDTKLWLLQAAKVLVVFVYAVVLVNLVLLLLGFFLQLFGASTDAEFTRWVYRNVERIMQPFRGMFPSQAISDQSVLDVSLLFAMILYSLVGIGVHALVTWLTNRIVALRRLRQVPLASVRQLGGPTPPPVAPPNQPGNPGRRTL